MKSINLTTNSKTLFFLIHGYTGSSTDFNSLPEYLHNSLRVDVKVILLKGHGTKITDLDNLKLNDFLVQIEDKLKKDLNVYEQVILGGVSFGAQMALYFATRYPVKGVFHVCLPYRLKFPFNIPALSLLRVFKKYWLKPIPKNEQKLRQEAFHYKEMHINGLKIVKQANRLLKKELSKITCPILTIHSKNDPIGNHKAVKTIDRKINVYHKKRIFDDKNHNIFFTDRRLDIYRDIENCFFPLLEEDIGNNNTIAAIVPAYNEAANISRVLEILSQADFLNEIIVIDDGSTDNTAEEASQFKQVVLLRNDKNKGKAYAMQQGVDATDANILFFCDADLKGLTTEIIKQIIQPVVEKRHDMYIGIRNNAIQKAVTLFALNSGERALRRELWNKLPDYFKYRYRIEAGLNFIAKSRGNGYGWKKFDYYQTLKEKKYGFLKGTALRWWMNLDVGYAYFLSTIDKIKR